MNTRPNSDGPEDIDAAFAEIVADLERDTKFGKWPGEDAEAPQQAGADDVRPEESTAPQAPVERAPEEGPRDWTPTESEDEEHFVPPEPPPVPVPRPATFLGIGIVVLGVLVLLIPGLAGIAATVKLPLGLVLISGGIGWLFFQLRQTRPDDSDDDGAQV